MSNSVPHKERRIDWRRVLLLLGAVVLATIAAALVDPNKVSDALKALFVTLFTVLAGFAVTLLTLLPDPISRYKDSKLDEISFRRAVEPKLQRATLLFYLYLATIALIVVAEILGPDVCFVAWLVRAYVFFAVLSLLLSFSLPSAILSAQRSRLSGKN